MPPRSVGQRKDIAATFSRNSNLRLTSGGLRPLHQPLEARVAPERGEVRVDLEPAGRQVIGNLEQGLQLVERLLGLADEDVDAPEIVLEVRPRL